VADFHRLRHCERIAPHVDVQFQFNLPRLRPRARTELSELLEGGQIDKLAAYAQHAVEYRKDCPEFLISALGAADLVPGPRADYNQRLSVERAAQVENWLRQHKVAGSAPEVICDPDGVGSHDPLTPTKPAGYGGESRRVILRSV